MAHPVVIRTKKLSSTRSVKLSGAHTWRERPTHNADPARTPTNTDLRAVHGSAALADAVAARVALATEKAKDPVLCIEYLVTAKHEAFTEGGGKIDPDAYFRDALAWLEARHGKDNIVAANVQRDEKTPHMVVYAVPLVEAAAKTRKRSVIVGTNPDGTKRRETREYAQPAAVRLSAAHFQGTPGKLSALQSDFAEAVGVKHGLKRGVPGSRAEHVTVKQYYARANAPFEPLPPVRPKPAPLRPEPQKPGFFASKIERQAYELDHTAWQKEQAAHKQQSNMWRKEAMAQAGAAVDVARRHEAQAREAGALRRTAEQLRESNGDYVRKSAELEAELTHVRGVAALFSPAEIANRQAEQAKQAQERTRKAAEAKQRDEIGKEYRKRVEALARLSERSAGAVHTFARHGVRALREAEDANRIDWNKVELAALRESMLEHGQPLDKVVEAITKHSPGCADPARTQRFEEAVARFKPELDRAQAQARAEQEQQQPKQSRGPRMRM
ncbi:MobV family relaxase [Burkholderia vietnamiensis]|uniref:MobV family relaxase n=1 Tax=Burkholderia vietnamiensis TaxID=60552 RepID=UPI001593DD71|nr:MobV family relaxase [Burkholderia vietnamiensis]